MKEHIEDSCRHWEDIRNDAALEIIKLFQEGKELLKNMKIEGTVLKNLKADLIDQQSKNNRLTSKIKHAKAEHTTEIKNYGQRS